ncbi:MarR family winged helix-turn-helix transcriptional regulator [Peptoniphilus stercorisuis]|uniref:DNA-binding MarR family transcriptional regulator n=1 Tax=Peptoniphilus stercorisuis TaxID=1436965 RepID=A0ABS4KBB8_9FIRM|nr:MarR family transcriptional regulator [Peptoniphilus stercorisuis]MBP2025072.1 DNA-binding MarR family transcriptional regulator [Peptoniphilus stercorisuis]
MDNEKLIEMLKNMQELRIFCNNISQRNIEGKVVSMQELDLLSRVNMSKNITSLELCNSMNLSKPAVSRLINRLIKKGLLKKERSEEDKRVYYLKLTNEGIEETKNVYLYYLDPLLKIKDAIGDNEFEKLINLIKLSNFKNKEMNR